MTGVPRALLRCEGLAVLAVAVLLYHRGDHSWLTFAVFFLVPDLTFAAFLAGNRVGAWVYDAAHTYVGVAMAAMLALLSDRPPIVALIWAAHIGLDRALGYGLKYESGFGDTHLGRRGRGQTSQVTPAS